MNMINWATLSQTEYENRRYNFLLWTEEGGDPALTPYNDEALPGAAGYITIGIGFNLEGSAVVRDEVFRTFGLIRNNPALSESAQLVENDYIDQLVSAIGRMVDDPSELNSIMANRAGNVQLAALGTRRSPFAFTDEPEIRATFDRLMTSIYEPKVNNWLAGIPDSRERTALVSLAWNAPELLGTKLKAAIVNGDRAEAWYEIRYQSNSRKQPSNIRDGIAKRRYFEADTFGLYDDAAANNEKDAKGAFRTYTRHKATMDVYDASFGGQVALAKDDYNTSIVQTRDAWLAPARAFLIDRYVTQPGLAVAITGDILVGENDGADGGTDTRYLRGSDVDTLMGTALNDLLFGESGNDRLDGGAGDDVLIGGAGEDTYVIEGHDIIVDSGRNWIVYNGQLIAGVFTDDGSGSTFVADDGRTLTFSSPGQLTLSPTDSVTYQNQTGAADFAGHAFGIYLRAAAPTPVPGPTTAGDGDNNDLAGTTGADWITGNGGRDLIQGRAGADVLFADALADIPAGPGYGGATPYADAVGDFVIGGADNDILVGSTLSDALLSGTGGDFIVAGAGHDIVYGDCTYVPSSGNGGHLNLSSDGHQTARTHVAP